MVPISLFNYRFKPNEGVIVIGATNFAEALDKCVSSIICLLLVCIHAAIQ